LSLDIKQVRKCKLIDHLKIGFLIIIIIIIYSICSEQILKYCDLSYLTAVKFSVMRHLLACFQNDVYMLTEHVKHYMLSTST